VCERWMYGVGGAEDLYIRGYPRSSVSAGIGEGRTRGTTRSPGERNGNAWGKIAIASVTWQENLLIPGD